MSQQGCFPPMDHDVYRGPISKCSGKDSAFIIWLRSEGKARFFREHAYEFSTRNHVDMQIIDQYWKNLDKKTKDKYKNIEKSEHNSKENIERRKMKKESKRVYERYKNVNLEAKTKEAHKATIKELDKELGPKFIPSLPRVSDPNTLFESDLLAHRSNLRKNFELLGRNKFFIREKTFDSLYDELLTFISVNVGFQYLDPDKVKLFCHPLEISLITFTLREGIKMKKTIHLDLDPAVIFQNTKVAMTPEEQRKCVTDISKETFLPTPQFTGTKEDAIKAWFEFKEAWPEIQPDIRSQLLCEKDCLNQVKAVLTSLAYAADMGEWHFMTTNVNKRIFPIEDFAMALAGTYEVKIQDKQVLNHFKVDYYPFQKGVVCEHHDQLKFAGDKLYCQQSMAMTSIYKLLQFLHKHDIFKFSTIYNPEIHEFCKIFKGSGPFPKNSNDILAIYDPTKHKNRLTDFVLVPSDKQKFPLEASRPASAKNDKTKRCIANPETLIRDSDMSDSSDGNDRLHFENNAAINRGFNYESSSNTVEDPSPPTLSLRKTVTNSGHQQQQAATSSKQSHQNHFDYQDDVISTPRPRINCTTKIQENSEDRRKSSSPPRQNMLRETNSGFGGNTRNHSSWNFQTNSNSNFYDRAARGNPSSSRNLSDNQERDSRTTRLLPSRGSDRQLDQGNRRESRIAELFSAVDIDGSQTVINLVQITSEERMAMEPCRLGIDFDPFNYTPNQGRECLY